jgi:hypothetical protein
MAYDKDVILELLAEQVGQAKTIREAYMTIVKKAHVEGVVLPDYDRFFWKYRKCMKNNVCVLIK